MRRLWNTVGYGMALVGFMQMLAAAGYSDTNTATAKTISIYLTAGLALFCLGALLVNAASFFGRTGK